ncbi:death domain-containing immune deficiency protein isoform X2 [Nomia melanderi]|uniref:death domain-containing immune deficiency protein isoform X2 n=1 Tax=Nomia melanderi TaxID=2448451 RepID=UPI00130401B3|nr:protein immune deficiency isoform X2 [Nomia melanderi]
MEITTQLSIDAIPEPPRVEIKGYTHNLNPDTTNEKSNVNPAIDKLLTNGSVPTNTNPDTQEEKEIKFPTCDSKPRSKPDVKTKTKPKQFKQSQGTRVVNYNIVNSNGVKIGARTSYICNVNQFPSKHTGPSDDSWSKPSTQQMPINVKHLCTCIDEITLEDIFIIKTHIGHGWKDVARRLSYSDGQIEQFEENYRYKGISEVIYQILLDWKQANTKDASIGNLTNLLWVCQEYDCATRLASVHENTI